MAGESQVPEVDFSRPPKSTSSRQRRGYASGKDDYLARLKKIEG